jgi:putative ABC transport system ATP-binding protein
MTDITSASLDRVEPILETSNISKLYPTPEGILTILDNINLQIYDSETVAIVGVSGSGKTTLLSLLAGLDLPTNGDIKIAGNSLTDADEDTRARLRSEYVGFVFQQFHLMANLSALENVALPLELAKHEDPNRIALEALQEVGLSDRSGHFPSALSGGEQQRVALARAYCCAPKILLADEPTGNLDQKTAGQISDLIFQLNQQKRTTLVIVTHDLSLAARCDRQIRLLEGRIA